MRLRRAFLVGTALTAALWFTPVIGPRGEYQGLSLNATGAVYRHLARNGHQDFIAVATVVFLTSGTSWSVPSDWNSANNTVEVIGGGGGGGVGFNAGIAQGAGGGGGGGWAKKNNVSLTPGGSVTVQIGVGGASNTSGTDTWLLSSATVKGTGGLVGGTGTGNPPGGAGGTSNVGDSTNNGGTGGAGASVRSGGGGGAGGPHGAGANGTAAGAGGNGDAGSGGAGGAIAAPGSDGSNYTATAGGTAGPGGGGGGSNGTGLAGGNYGAGGSGGRNTGFAGGAGRNGLIVLTYTPSASVSQKIISLSQSVTRASYW